MADNGPLIDFDRWQRSWSPSISPEKAPGEIGSQWSPWFRLTARWKIEKLDAPSDTDE